MISAVAAGAFGEVYLVRDLSGVSLALKLLKTDSVAEVSSVARLRQKVGSEAGLVAIHHIGEFEGRVYYTMDAADNMASEETGYCPDTLENRLAFHGALNAFEVLDVAEALAGALDVLHAHGLVHRDLKPSNVIFKDGKPLLADFGLASSADGGMAGTPGFMPPERLPAEAKAAQQARDFYALGKVIYCGLTNGDATRFPILPKDYSIKEVSAIRKIWLKACASKPSQRFLDGESFVAAIQTARRELCGMTAGRRSWFWRCCVPAAPACVLAGILCFTLLPMQSSDIGEETSVYVNIERVRDDYLVFCCFTVGSDLDPMSDYNRRKAAALTVDALRRYLNLPSGATVRPRRVTREREPERNGGVMIYYYRMPVGACEIQGGE
ncbi:MAG: serine/threonine-protein kinase [Kiritimatiellia bacterium]